MALTFQSVIDKLTETIQRDDLVPDYLDFVNEAVHELALAHSFEQMKAIGTGTVAPGTTRAQLPPDFKELQDGRYPVFDSVAGSLVPVFTRPEIEKLLGNSNALGFVPPICYIYTQDFTAGQASFNLDLPAPDPNNVSHLLTMNYFAYPAIQTDPTQTTPLITYYFNMVFQKSASLAFDSINDPAGQAHENEYMKMLQPYIAEDLEASQADVTGKRT